MYKIWYEASSNSYSVTADTLVMARMLWDAIASGGYHVISQRP